MKHSIVNGIAIFAIAIGIAACGNGGDNTSQKNGKKFAPQERTSSKTDEERQAAIAQKKAELNVNLETLLDSHKLRISILQPLTNGDITDNVADRFSMRMLEIAAQNGISGMGTNPNFVLGVEINQTGRAATGTTPQKMTVQYELLFKVMNAVTGDVYGVSKQEVMGVGNSFEEASVNAANEIKNTTEMQNFLNTCSDLIINWYNDNVAVLKNEVEKAEGSGDYAFALALLESVPEQATVAYQYVTEKQPGILSGLIHKMATDMLSEMESVLASSGDDFNPAVGAYFSLIPMDSPEHATAQKLYADYEKKCDARRATLEAKAERDEQAALELAKLNMLYDHQAELAQMEVEKMMYHAQAQANATAAANQPHGFFGSLGYAITRTTDAIFDGLNQ